MVVIMVFIRFLLGFIKVYMVFIRVCIGFLLGFLRVVIKGVLGFIEGLYGLY